jgi:hypothetical protein
MIHMICSYVPDFIVGDNETGFLRGESYDGRNGSPMAMHDAVDQQ